MSATAIVACEAPTVEESIAVLGAGISGLVAAHELGRYGLPVEVYEADQRCGGRIYTHRFVCPDGGTSSVELGAMRIPGSHRRTLELVEQLGLTGSLRPFYSVLGLEENLLRIGDEFVPVRAATPHLSRLVSAMLPGVSADTPAAALGGWFLAVVDAIAPAELRAAARMDLAAVVDAATRIDLSRYIHGGVVDLHGALVAHAEIIAACSPRLRSFGHDIVTEYSKDMFQLEGGMALLVDGVRSKLRGPVRLRNIVRAVGVHEGHVAVTVDGPGGMTTRRHPRVVCTLPFSVMRHIAMTGVSEQKRATIESLDYGAATKVAFHTRRPFWRERGIGGGASAPGGRIRQTYYSTSEPGSCATLIGSYTIAEDAEVLGRMSPERRHRVVHREVAAMHPEIDRPGMLLGSVSRAWGQHPWSRGCAARRWDDDDAGRRGHAERAARREGLLYFAGEHCSTTPAWVDSAIQSAHRVVEDVWCDHRRGAA